MWRNFNFYQGAVIMTAFLVMSILFSSILQIFIYFGGAWGAALLTMVMLVALFFTVSHKDSL